jgi:hypothetical protein
MQRDVLVFGALVVLFAVGMGVALVVQYFTGGAPKGGNGKGGRNNKGKGKDNAGGSNNNGKDNAGGSNNKGEDAGGSNNNGGNAGGPNDSGGCPDVTDNVLPACELERRRDEAGRSYCPRGVCGEGLVAVPDFKTAYTICVPQGARLEDVCP